MHCLCAFPQEVDVGCDRSGGTDTGALPLNLYCQRLAAAPPLPPPMRDLCCPSSVRPCDLAGCLTAGAAIAQALGLNYVFLSEFEELRSPLRDARSQASAAAAALRARCRRSAAARSAAHQCCCAAGSKHTHAASTSCCPCCAAPCAAAGRRRARQRGAHQVWRQRGGCGAPQVRHSCMWGARLGENGEAGAEEGCRPGRKTL